MEGLNDIVVSAIGVFVSIIALICTIRQTQQQQKLLFFADYTKRYQEIVLHFPIDIYSEDFNFDKLKTEAKEEVLRYFRAYFDLCSEEYHLQKRGKIDKVVWLEWEEGIKFNFGKRAFRDAWLLLNCKTYHPEFQDFIKSSLS